ncbi:MAG TPA: sialidase family protein [Ignavibacteria bacterium]|nr:sialidase family protein [Ignavibacteria bacterium]
MKTKLLLLLSFLMVSWFMYSGFSNDDDSPRWNINPSTRISISPEGQYVDLPQGTNEKYSNEIRYTSTPQGVFAVGPNFRVHPRSAGTQSETPITRHPLNPNFMYASANTWQGGLFCTSWYVTTNGGLTWTGNDSMISSGGAFVNNNGDPAPMVMYTGRMLISYITTAGRMGASYSTNNGTNWSSTVTFPGSSTASDKNLSATDGQPSSPYYGRCYTVYTEFSGAYVNRIVSTYSDDGGLTWSSVIPVSPVPSAGHHHQGCDIVVDVYGWCRVVWANCTTNGQNSTEDSLGWAESGTGGTSWSDASNHKVNTNGIRTSDLLPSPPAGVIRMNGFPRIATDRTCLSSRDDDYVVMAEKNFAPAIDNADIVLMKTPDGGSSWTRTRVNQNAAGPYEYCPAVDVDETGAINVVYYSTRNTATNDSAEIYLSRSTDGGATFTDIKVSDHKFKPLPISGLASGYQGDYIGVTSGGPGKIVAYWCEQGPSSGGRYQAWSSLIDITKGEICEDFSCDNNAGTSTLPVYTPNFFEEYSGTNYWRILTPSAYNIGANSARFNCWSAAAGTQQSLVSYQFPNAPANTYITFDVAYQPWSGGNVDSLIIETSSNQGASYTIREKLWGGLGAQAGPLNTVFTGGGQLTPTGGQWRSRIYPIPSGTNKIKLRARSGFGNDIWLDNICVQTLPTPINNSIGLANQAMFINTNPYWRLANEPVKVYLHRTDFPNIVVDSATGTMGSNAVCGDLLFNRALNGTYYKEVRHRNSLETWSIVGTSYTRGSNSNYNFIQPDNQAYGNNQAVVSTSPFYRGIYSGDVDQNGLIDLGDLIVIYNDAINFVSGYEITDLNGDLFTNLTDVLYAYNNAADFVQVSRPPGAEPLPAPLEEEVSKPVSFENDADRQKYELTQKLSELQITDIAEVYVPNWGVDLNDVERLRKMKIEEQKNLKLNIKVENNNAGNR